MKRRNRTVRTVPLMLLSVLIAACGESAPAEPVELPAPETFTWIGQPVSFSPPPDWTEGPWKQGGLTGLIYTRSGSPPGLISITQYHQLRRGHSRTNGSTGTTRKFAPAPSRFGIDDVVDRVRFQTEDLSPFGEVEILNEARATVASLPAIQLEYTFDGDNGRSLGRELYVVAERELFALKVRGNPADLDLFEQVVATVTFPTTGRSR